MNDHALNAQCPHCKNTLPAFLMSRHLGRCLVKARMQSADEALRHWQGLFDKLAKDKAVRREFN